MDFLIRFTQTHETFRLAEVQALAVLEGIDLKVKHYSTESPFCLVTLPSPESARRLVSRAVLVQSIYEHWGTAPSLPALQEHLKQEGRFRLPRYQTCSFKINFDSFQNTRAHADKVALINSFAFLGFQGPIALKNPDEEFCVLEEWPLKIFTATTTPASPNGAEEEAERQPSSVHFGRLVGIGARDLPNTYNLKKRTYISTTSMDSELALVTANIALSGPGKLFYDPFVGTGSFPLACAHFGALAFGSDIDGRSIRGQGKERSVRGNFAQYGLGSCLGGMWVADLTNTPVRCPGDRRLFDGIVCDPPYGVREGLKVLGCRDPEKTPWSIAAGIERSHLPDYIPPKKPYSFLAMLDDILDFAANTLVDEGRLAFWMPTSNEESEEIKVPTHPCLEVVAVCSQDFNRWSRKLIAYRRMPDVEVDAGAMQSWATRQVEKGKGTTANELNPFRRMYFKS